MCFPDGLAGEMIPKEHRVVALMTLDNTVHTNTQQHWGGPRAVLRMGWRGVWLMYSNGIEESVVVVDVFTLLATRTQDSAHFPPPQPQATESSRRCSQMR